ncbi:MAG TPA: iron-sulfur cluster assembly protein [Acidimicrobiales bacterium]|nr:iron-sulfur cluster assembly protein [Acidimicrobiales bacterium]
MSPAGHDLPGPSDDGWTEVIRHCVAVTVPDGDRIVLVPGTKVEVLQRMGDSCTVRNEYGHLLRVGGADFDAIGLEASERAVMISGASSGPFEMDAVTAALHTVYDPEIPVSIVDLGLIYRCDEIVDGDGKRRIEIDMTMTSPGCGMGDILCDDAARVVRAVPGVDDVVINLVFDPPWGLDRMTEEVRLELGLL